jgi:hypothetical protein
MKREKSEVTGRAVRAENCELKIKNGKLNEEPGERDSLSYGLH